MPLYYTSILKEHRAVRSVCGIFDVSHLGLLEVRGPSAGEFLQRMVTQDLGKLVVGQARYTPMCNEQGGILDEMILYRLEEERYRLVVNAANAERDLAWLTEHSSLGVEILDLRQRMGALAIQGPLSCGIVERVCGMALLNLRYYRCLLGHAAGCQALIARTGYTGEDGFEIMAPLQDLPAVWEASFEAGRPLGMLPVGLGARDTLRLEAGMPLYGGDLDETTTPFEAGLGRTVAFGKPDFIGRSALWRLSQEGARQLLVGFVMEEPGVPRHGYPLQFGGRKVGQVTSGTYSPTLARNIGLGYVVREASEPGTALTAVIHGRPTRATVVALPFYRHHGKH